MQPDIAIDLQEALFGIRLSDLYMRELLHPTALIADPQPGPVNMDAPVLPWERPSSALVNAPAKGADGQESSTQLKMACAHFYHGDLKAATAAAKRVTGKLSSEAAIILAENFIASGEFDKAHQIYNSINQTSSEEDRTIPRSRLLRCKSAQGDVHGFRTFIHLLRPAERQAPLMVLTLAEHELIFGDTEQAEQMVSTAYDTATGNSKRWLAWELGRICHMTGRPVTATDWYQQIVLDMEDSLGQREFIHVLYKADLLSGALRRARAVRLSREDVVVGITEIEADCLLKAGNDEEAKELLDALAEKHPYNDASRL